MAYTDAQLNEFKLAGINPSTLTDQFVTQNVTGTTNTNTGLLGTAQPVSTTTTPAAATVANVTPNNVASVAPLAEMKAREITPKETVAGQLNDLLKQDSPYMQSATNRANEMSASRGLLNSSMAVGAAQRAAIDAGAPIAAQDATTYGNAGQLAQQGNQEAQLTGYRGLLESAQQKEGFGYQSALQNSQNQTQLSIAGMQAQTTRDNNSAQIASQQFMQGLDLTSKKDLQDAQITYNEGRDIMENTYKNNALTSDERKTLITATGAFDQQLLDTYKGIQTTPDTVLDANGKATAWAGAMKLATDGKISAASLYNFKMENVVDKWPVPNYNNAQAAADSAVADNKTAAEKKAAEEAARLADDFSIEQRFFDTYGYWREGWGPQGRV